MSDLVRITDVSPRDGLQNEPGIIPTEQKVELVRLLCETGVDEVEVSSFVSPKWVPQLGDAEDVFRALLPLPEGGGWGEGARTPAHNPVAAERAKELRREMTGPERELWRALSAKLLAGFKFRRQHPFGPFILDFYCPANRLVIEVDGTTHTSPDAQHKDASRTKYLESYGLRVIRFSDDEVLKNVDGVTERILAALRDRAPSTPSPQPPPSERGSTPVVLSALVPNERGMQSLLDVNRRAQFTQVGKASVFTAASESFSKRNTNATIDETLQRFRPVVAAASQSALLTRGYVSCAIACPFEGPIPPEVVASVAAKLALLGIDELDLGDTIGAGTPESVAGMLRVVLERLGQSWLTPSRLTLHLHDTFNRAADCVKAALDCGVRSFDGSVAGLGGCPYASTPGKRAPGNISTELLVRTIEAAGFRTNVNLDKLADAADFARKIVAAARASSGGGAA